MRIQTNNVSHPPRSLVPATVRPDAPRRDASASRQNHPAPLAAYVAQPNPLDVIRGVSARGQRAIAAYTQNDRLEQRGQYSQLLGVDVYA